MNIQNTTQNNLETSRLLLRPFLLTDAPRVQLLAGNYQVAKPTLNIPHPYEDGMAEAWIEALDEHWQQGESLIYAITLKADQTLIGAIGLVGINNDEGIMGYWIGEPYWGKGYCSEASQALIDFCFNDLKLSRIEAEYLQSNPASGRVMEKSGMHYIRTKTIDDRDGKVATLNVYEINN